MVTQYIFMQTLVDLYEGSERAPGSRVGMQWWGHVGIDLARAREGAVAMAEWDGGEE